jgi:hypothetical protein
MRERDLIPVPVQHQGRSGDGGELGQVDLRFGVDHRHRLGIDDVKVLRPVR